VSAESAERASTVDNGGPRPPASAETESVEKPLVYVASLSDYNAGRLHGIWLDPAQDLHDVREEVTGMLRRSRTPGAEEYAIHDFSGFGRHVELGEYTDLERVHALARGMQTYGMSFAAWWSYVNPLSSEEAELRLQFEDEYLGTWGTVEDFAEQRLDDLGAVEAASQVPVWLQSYLALDIESFARDMVLGGDILAIEDIDSVHIFEGNAG